MANTNLRGIAIANIYGLSKRNCHKCLIGTGFTSMTCPNLYSDSPFPYPTGVQLAQVLQERLIGLF